MQETALVAAGLIIFFLFFLITFVNTTSGSRGFIEQSASILNRFANFEGGARDVQEKTLSGGSMYSASHRGRTRVVPWRKCKPPGNVARRSDRRLKSSRQGSPYWQLPRMTTGRYTMWHRYWDHPANGRET
jgi:hypothetical protein